MSFKITWKTHVICTIIAFLLAKILGSIATNIVENFILKPFISYPTSNEIINFYIYIILLMIPISIVHEAIHGLATNKRIRSATSNYWNGIASTA